MTRVGAVLAAGVLAASSAPAQTHLVVITGLSGEPRYAEAFRAWALALTSAAEERYGLPRENIHYLAESVDGGPARAKARATRDEIARVLGALADSAAPDALIAIVLIGHGSADGRASRFHLPGPDLTAAECAKLLAAFPTQRVVVVNAASASGDWIAALSGERRIVMTATRSGSERLETRFGGYFAEALASDAADTNADERVSMLEAFEYARRRVAQEYGRDDKMLTEHALLDDDGDGRGTLEPDASGGDGVVAARVFLEAGRRAAPADPRLAPLYTQRDSLEALIGQHQDRKARLDSAAYHRELERLLLDLARTNRALRELEGREP